MAEQAADEARTARRILDAYGIALGLVVLSVVVSIGTGAGLTSPVAAAAALLQIAALVVTLRVSGVSHRRFAIASAIVALVFVTATATTAVFGTAGRMVGTVTWLVLVILTIAAIAKRLATYRQVNGQLVMGLLVVYVLLGLTFALAYLALEVAGVTVFTQGAQGMSGATYFSYVTLATLGYGDITPAVGVGRALAIAEAITGQLYLVSVVALAVGRYGARRPEKADSADV